ncbi:unnamed protein product, partial [Ceratitis capitata]
FSEQPKYTEVNPGQDALLTCKVIDKRGTCSWQKDNKWLKASEFKFNGKSDAGKWPYRNLYAFMPFMKQFYSLPLSGNGVVRARS